jgi:uncharacterized protein (TIGR03435 family)
VSLFLLLSLFMLMPQDQQPVSLQFDVAALKHSTSSDPRTEAVHRSPGLLSMRNTPIERYIQMAYRVRSSQIVGPRWLSSEMYDLEAKSDQPSTDADLRIMLQHLLEERLHLTLHHEIKQQDGYLLVGDPKGRPDNASWVAPADKFQPPTVTAAPEGVHEFKSTTMAQLAYYLSQELDQTVINNVPVTGIYDFVIKWSSGPMRIAHFGVPETTIVTGPGPTIFEGIRELGLILKASKVPVDYLVIDHIDKLPAD